MNSNDNAISPFGRNDKREGKIRIASKQIIALARVLYKKPQFLILDEATSAMDRNTENFTMQLLQKIKPTCAILFISHRLNTLKTYADEIYILENKTISLKGTHVALLETKNFYSDFYN
jgi:ATP-binding cassette subfamily B protein